MLNSKPYRVSVNKNGFLVEKNPVTDVPVGSTNLGRFNSFREAAQAGRETCIKLGIIGRG